ncbi:MAG: hypothetical protein IJE63_02975, partial [Clostridia bacterium]|nr:hypothetical protein [Clostridia bacterium]
MKTVRRAVAVLLCIACVLSCTCFAGTAQTSDDTAAGFTQDDFLSAKGQKIVNRKGEEITLKGVNLGSWMIWEDWLSPYGPYEEKLDHYTVLTELEDRFGRDKAYELFNTYMD